MSPNPAFKCARLRRFGHANAGFATDTPVIRQQRKHEATGRAGQCSVRS